MEKMQSRLHKTGIAFAYNEVMVCGSVCHVFRFRDYVSLDVLSELFKDIWFQALSFNADKRCFMYIEREDNGQGRNIPIYGGNLADVVAASGVLDGSPGQAEQLKDSRKSSR